MEAQAYKGIAYKHSFADSDVPGLYKLTVGGYKGMKSHFHDKNDFNTSYLRAIWSVSTLWRTVVREKGSSSTDGEISIRPEGCVDSIVST